MKHDFRLLTNQLTGVLAEFDAETDRGTAVTAAAYLDDLLAAFLRRFFVDDKKTVESLLENQGPLGTFASRINLAYCMGLIREDQFKDLHMVRKIRNAFAHSHQSQSFETQSIGDMCENLGQIKMYETYRDEMSPLQQDVLIDRWKTRREKFIGNSFHLAMGLMARATGATHRKPGRTVFQTRVRFDWEEDPEAQQSP